MCDVQSNPKADSASALLDIGCDISKEHEHEVIIMRGSLYILQLRHTCAYPSNAMSCRR